MPRIPSCRYWQHGLCLSSPLPPTTVICRKIQPRLYNMGSNDDLPSSLPRIVLGTTITDLYKRAAPRHAAKRIGQVLCGVNSGMALSSDFPRNAKFIYQDSPF